MPRGSNITAEIFLALNFPWDQSNNHLWKCVTWTFVKDGEKRFANYAAQDFNGVLHLIETRAGRNNCDVYIGLGTQRMSSLDVKSVDGYPKAERKIANVVSFNSIYLDIDVGKAGAYATTSDAFAALDDFIDKVGLPETSMEVLSGSGGLHAYWCFKDPVPVPNWIPLATALRDAALAYGLKFDPQVTVNAAGILRVPGTFNHKAFPPKPVTLLEDTSFNQYDYQQMVGALSKYIGTSLSGVRAHQVQSVGMSGNFTANVGVAPPIALDDVLRVCPTLNDIEARGGNGDPEPLWNLAMMVASFTDDPVDAAHRLSDGDPRYTKAETDRKLHEKINARTQNPAIGWPQCASFSPLHTACATCPLFAQGKSPLNFATKPTPSQPVNPGSPDRLMPFGYWRDINNHVFTTIVNDKTKLPVSAKVLEYPIYEAGIDAGNGHLVFKTSISGIDRWCSPNIHSNMQPGPAAQVLASQGIWIMQPGWKVARDFVVSWMGHLQSIKQTITPDSYGWTDDGKGFTFDQTVYSATGKEVAFRGSSHDPRFIAKGDIKLWQSAMDLVYGNPSLEVVVASAFASPLLELVSSTSVVLSAYSADSGIGKTTAMMLGQAVWGDPRTGMSALADTLNSVMKKVADLRNLPIYWDELHTRDQVEKVVDMVFQVTQGKGKARLNKDITQAAAPSFTTMFVVASNHGISDDVYHQTDGTEAGGLRVFELEAEPHKSTIFANHEAIQRLKPIEKNFGNAGAIYAEFIAQNRATIQQIIDAKGKDLHRKYNFTSKERFWAMTLSTLTVGATLANHAGLTRFDIPAIETFLGETLVKMRQILSAQEFTTLSQPGAGEDVLGEMMASLRGKHLLVTDRIHYGMGRPGLVDASATGDLTRLGDVWMQYGEKDGRFRVRAKPFNTWLREHRQHPTQILKLLGKSYHVQHGKFAIGSGVPFLDAIASQRYTCIDFTPFNFRGSNPGSS